MAVVRLRIGVEPVLCRRHLPGPASSPVGRTARVSERAHADSDRSDGALAGIHASLAVRRLQLGVLAGFHEVHHYYVPDRDTGGRSSTLPDDIARHLHVPGIRDCQAGMGAIHPQSGGDEYEFDSIPGRQQCCVRRHVHAGPDPVGAGGHSPQPIRKGLPSNDGGRRSLSWPCHCTRGAASSRVAHSLRCTRSDRATNCVSSLALRSLPHFSSL